MPGMRWCVAASAGSCFHQAGLGLVWWSCLDKAWTLAGCPPPGVHPWGHLEVCGENPVSTGPDLSRRTLKELENE